MLKIDVISDNYCICGFEVTDEYGVKYFFGKDSQSGISDYTEISTDSNYEYTAWMMRKITLPDDNLSEIHFTWVKNRASGSGGLSGYAYDGGMPVFLEYRGSNPIMTSFHEKLREVEHSINPNNRYGYSLQLKQVDFPLGSIKLDYCLDIALNSFKVLNSANEVIKQIHFTYEDGHVSSYSLLSSVTFSDEGKYRFTYNPERFMYLNGQDYWGYYNGKSQSVLTPKTRMVWGFGHQINFSGADRSIDRNKMQANMLTRIDYPTGGYTEFEYEPHRFEEPVPRYNIHYGQLTEGRGLRVSKVLTKTDTESTPVIKTYLYGKNTGNGFNTNGLGIVNTDMSTLDSFWEVYSYETLSQYTTVGLNIPVYMIIPYKCVYIHSISHFDRVFSAIPPVYYNYVTEFISSGDNSVKLKTEYTYSNVKTDVGGYLTADGGHYFIRSEGNLFSKGPDLTNKKTYKTNSNGNYSPAENSSYRYAERFDDAAFGLYVNRVRNNTVDGPDFSSPDGFLDGRYGIVHDVFGTAGSPHYNYIETRINPLYSELTGETNTQYTANGEVTTDISYTYKDNTLLLKKEVTGSDGAEVTEEYQYRTYNNRLYAYPTSITRKENTLLESKEIQYYSNKISQVQSLRLYQNDFGFSGLRVIFHNYNNYGKLAYLTQDDATRIVYLWSYKGQYPVAEIKNATYDQVKAVIPDMTINSLANASAPTTDQLDLVNSLRLQLPQALVTTYTYKPLAGIQTVTNPQGLTVRYDYDAFGRLKQIRDDDAQLLNWFQYNQHDGSGREEESAVYQPVRLKFNYYADTYIINWNTQRFQTFRALKAGGSASCQFIWTIRNSNNEVLAVHNSGTNPEYRMDLARWGSGQMTLTCTVEDLITHETKSIYQPLKVYMTPLIFEDIRWPNKYAASGTVVTANLISESRKTVRFIHESQLNNVAYLFKDSIQGTRTFLFNSGTESRDIVIESGITTVELLVANGNPSLPNQVKFKIAGSDYPLTHIGSPYKWLSDYLVYPSPY